jgi:hypothetical protein
MEWPKELNDKIVGLHVTGDLRAVVTEMRTNLKPHLDGSVENPFLIANERLPEASLAPTYVVEAPLPSVLRPFYEAYGPSVEFRCGTLALFSERDMQEVVPGRVVDFGFKYRGLGTIYVFSYDRPADVVLTAVDGGANGYDRVLHQRLRRVAIQNYVDGKEADVRPRSFATWWREEAAESYPSAPTCAP